MASWKKVIVSGSDAHLNHITSSGNIEVVGNISGSATSTGSFGRVEASTLQGTIVTPSQTNITSVGTIGTGTWQGTEVGLGYGGTELVGETDGKIVVADGSGAPVHLDIGSSSGITILGTIATGVWNGTKVASAYLDDDTAHLTTDQTFTGNKTFSAPITGSHYSGSATSTGSFGRIEVLANTLAIGGTEIGKTVADNITALDQQLSTTSSPTFANLTTTGDVIAQNYIVSSSVTYMTQSFSSGSTTFGNSADDTHVFVGNTISGSSTSSGSFGKVYADTAVRIGMQDKPTDYMTYGLVVRGGDAKIWNGQKLWVNDVVSNYDANSRIGFYAGIAGVDTTLEGRVFIKGEVNGTEMWKTTATHAISGSSTSTGSFGRILTAGKSLFNNQIWVNTNGSATVPSVNVIPQGGNGFYKYASNEIGVAANGASTLRISSTAGLEVLRGNISGSASSTGSFGAVSIAGSPLINGNSTGIGIGTSVSERSGTPGEPANTLHIVSAVSNGNESGAPIKWGNSTYKLGYLGGAPAAYNSGAIVLFQNGYDTAQVLITANGTSEFNAGGIYVNGNISGSAASTGSFGSLVVSDKVQGNLTIGGNLIIEGDTVQQQVANLNVEDRFILLNSGSASGDGGLVVQTESHTAGVVYGYDDSESRWGFQQGTKLYATASVLAPDAYASAVVTSDDSNYQKNGNIRVESGEIYIYVE